MALTTDKYNWVYLHQGGRLDPVTGLYDFRHRPYTPSLGRWMTQDQIGDRDGMNLYQDEASNPINLLDPQGLTGGQGPGSGKQPVLPPGACCKTESPPNWQAWGYNSQIGCANGIISDHVPSPIILFPILGWGSWAAVWDWCGQTHCVQWGTQHCTTCPKKCSCE
jgi:RHS repeat-associated protein